MSYISGDTPVWKPQSVGQLKPWNYEQYPIVSQLCREARTEGIVIDQMVKRCGARSMQYCLITNKQAQLSIGVFSESKVKTVGEYLQFWPMQLDLYEFPLVLALDCPQEINTPQTIIRHSQFIQKCASNTFKFKIEKKDFEKLSQDNYHVSWLGKFIDAHHFVDDKLFQSVKDKNLVEIHAQPQWSLKKRSVCWIIIDDIKECSNTSLSPQEVNLTHKQKAVTSDQVIHSDKLRAINPNSEGSSDKSAMGTSRFSRSLPSISIPNASLIRKRALAAFMTICREGGEPVFLFWDVSTANFNRKCYAEFHTNITFPWVPADFGNWYELTYWDAPNHKMRIIVSDYRKTEPKAVTRVRDEICAQFSTNWDRFINVWHAIFPCKAKNNYYHDMGWWPWLCRACYPDLRDMTPPIVQKLSTTPGTSSKSVEIQNQEVLSQSLVELATKMRKSLAIEEGNIRDYSDTESISSLPVKKAKQDVKQSQQLANVDKQKSASISQFPINSNTQTALAVFLTVRDNDELVFLFFNGQEKKFDYRIHADTTHNLTIGKWYNLSYKLLNTTGLQNGQKVAIMSAKLINNGPVETRVYNGRIAQFNSKPAFLSGWHKSKRHKPAMIDLADAKSPWWPKICIACYPNTKSELEQNETSQVKAAGKSKRQYTSIAPGHEGEYTDSEPDTESVIGSCVTGEVQDDLSIEDGSEEESPNITPTGTPKPNANAAIDYLVQRKFPDLAEKPFSNGFSTTKLDTFNSPVESTKKETNQQNGNALNTNGPSTSSMPMPQLDGSFGSARRLRGYQLAKSAFSSSKPPPCSGDGSK